MTVVSLSYICFQGVRAMEYSGLVSGRSLKAHEDMTVVSLSYICLQGTRAMEYFSSVLNRRY